MGSESNSKTLGTSLVIDLIDQLLGYDVKAQEYLLEKIQAENIELETTLANLRHEYQKSVNKEYVLGAEVARLKKQEQDIDDIANDIEWKCDNCREDIFYDREAGEYKHMATNLIKCDSIDYDNFNYKYVAIPTPRGRHES